MSNYVNIYQSNYVAIHQKKGEPFHRCKFNVSERMEQYLLPELEKHFQLELSQGTITRKNKRTVVEMKVSPFNAALIRQAFISMLPIFESQN